MLVQILRENRNYRYTWFGQVVSEVGDHFNNIAVFSLALSLTRSGAVVSGIMLSRAIPAVLAGPVAGVLLDRMDRKKIMILSDLFRACIAAAFILTIESRSTWLLYLLSGLLMFASPFFTSGRSAILPSITREEELHAANSLSQTTQWTTLSLGAITVCYLIHGGAYVLFSQVESFPLALVFIALSRAGVGVSSVLNFTQLLRRVPNRFRGRVFSTMESMVWSTMILSMALTGVASQYYDPRVIGAWSGALSSTTALFWTWAHLTGRLPRSEPAGIDPDRVEVHGEPRFTG